MSGSLGRDALIGCCPLQNAHVLSPGSQMVGCSGDSAVGITRAPRTSGDCTVNNITLAFSPESAHSPGGISGTSEPCLDDSRFSPPHCTSFLPFSPGRNHHPPPVLPRLPPKTEGDGRVSVISLSSKGLVSGSCSSRDMRVGLLRQPLLSTSSSSSSTSTSSSTSSTSTSSSSSFSSSPSLSSVNLAKPSLEVQSSRCPITVGGPSSHCNLHHHSSSPLSLSLSLFAAKENTNSVALQQIDHHSSPPCAASEESSSSSESYSSTQMLVFHTKPPNGYSHNGHPSSRDPSSSFSPTSSSPPMSNSPTAVRSKGTAVRQPPIAVACHGFADLMLLNEREAQHICSDGSSLKVQALKPLQAQANRSRILDPDVPLIRLGRNSGIPSTTGVVHESRGSHTLPNVGGDMLNLLQTSPGVSTAKSNCTHNSLAVPTLTFGSFQHRSGNYLLTGSDDEDSSDDSHGNRNSLKPVQQPFRHCIGIPRPLRGSFLKIQHLKNLPPSSLPAATKLRTQSIVGHSSVIHTSCSKGDGRMTLRCDNTATDGLKEGRTACETSYRFESGSDAKQPKQGKYRFPDPFENADVKFCKRVSHVKSLVAQTIRWEQNRRMKKHS